MQSFDFTDEFTVEAWFRVLAFNVEYSTIVSKGNSAWALRRCAAARTICFETQGTDARVLATKTQVSDGEWHHVAAVLGDGVKRLYVDGVLDASTSVDGAVAVNDIEVRVGDNGESGPEVQNWNGEIDSVRIWSRALTADEVAAGFNQAVVDFSTAGLVTSILFDEASGTAAGGAVDGTLHSATATGVTWVPSGAPSFGGAVVVQVAIQSLAIVPLRTDDAATTVHVTSLPTGGSLFQYDHENPGEPGLVFSTVPRFVKDSPDDGRVYFLPNDGILGPVKFNFELSTSDSSAGTAVVTNGVAIVHVVDNRRPIAGGGGYAVQLNGLGDYVDVDNSNGEFDSDVLTVEGWLKPVYQQFNSSLDRSCFFAISEGEGVRLGAYLVHDYDHVIVSVSDVEFTHKLPTRLTEGAWVHVLLQVDATVDETYRLAIDGDWVGSGNTTSLALARAWAFNFPKKLTLGYSPVANPANFRGDYFVGEMDSVRVWSSKLSDRFRLLNRYDLLQDPADLIAGSDVGHLLGIWEFDEGEDQYAFDGAANPLKRTAVLVGNTVAWVTSSQESTRVGLPDSALGYFQLPYSDVDGQTAASITLTKLPSRTVNGSAAGGISMRTFVDATEGSIAVADDEAGNSTRRARGTESTLTRITSVPFTIDDPDSAELVYTPTESRGGEPYDTIEYTVNDGVAESLLAGVLYLDVQCPEGSFANENRVCEACPIGTYADIAGLVQCIPCAAGSVADSTGTIECALCPAGTYTADDGESTCVPCPLGTHASEAGTGGQCTPCASGRYAPLEGLSECFICPVTEFQPDEGQAACMACPENTESIFKGVYGADDVAQCQCQAGYYIEEQVTGVACDACPDGGVCTGATALPVPARGYWASEDVRTEFFECPALEACPGGAYETCAEGHTGVQCAECLDGYYLLDRECRTCPSAGANVAIIIFVCLAFFLLAYILYASAKSSRNRANYSVRGGLGQCVAIFVTYCQISAIFFRWDVSWPSYVESVMRSVSFFNFNTEVFALQCNGTFFPQASTRLIFTLVSPLIFVLVLAIGFALGKVHEAFVRATGDKYEAKHPGAAQRPPAGSGLGAWFSWKVARFRTVSRKPRAVHYANAVVRFADFAYVFLVMASLELFNCQDQPNGDATWVIRPSVRCEEDDTWWAFLPVTVIGILAYLVAIPLVFALALRNHHRKVFGFDGTKRPRIALFSVLWSPFKNDYYWWQMVVIARKFAVPFIVVTWGTSMEPMTYTLLTTFLLFAFACLQIYYKPYRYQSVNNFELFALAGHVLVLVAGLVYVAVDRGGLENWPSRATELFTDVMCGVFFFAPVAAFLIFTAHILRRWKRDLDNPLEPRFRKANEVLSICDALRSISYRPDAVDYYLEHKSSDERISLKVVRAALEELTRIYPRRTPKKDEDVEGGPDADGGKHVGPTPEEAVEAKKKAKEDGKSKDKDGKSKDKDGGNKVAPGSDTDAGATPKDGDAKPDEGATEKKKEEKEKAGNAATEGEKKPADERRSSSPDGDDKEVEMTSVAPMGKLPPLNKKKE